MDIHAGLGAGEGPVKHSWFSVTPLVPNVTAQFVLDYGTVFRYSGFSRHEERLAFAASPPDRGAQTSTVVSIQADRMWAKAKGDSMTTLKVNAGDFGSLALDGEKFYFRCRSFVDIKTGQPLPERRQQKVVVATKDTSLYKSVEKSSALHQLADELRKKIVACETAAKNGQTVTAQGEVEVEVPVDPNDDITVAEFFKTTFLTNKKALMDTEKLAAITFDTYQRYWDMFLSKHFNAAMTIKTYKPSMGRHYLQNLRKPDGESFYGENTVKKVHSVASAIFTEAVELEYREDNPWQNIKRDKIPNVSAEQGVAYTEAQVETIIKNLDADLGTKHGRKDFTIRTAQVVLALGFWAGLRPSEIISLKFENLDVDAGRLTV
jgi:translation initiation factor 1 (eIF-1/SUI1)